MPARSWRRWLRGNAHTVSAQRGGHHCPTTTILGTTTGNRQFRLVATRANLQRAFGVCLVERQAPVARAAIGMQVSTLAEPHIAAITQCADTSLLSSFGLPRSLASWRVAE